MATGSSTLAAGLAAGPASVQAIDDRTYRPIVDPPSILNNCGPAALVASATGVGGCATLHQIIRLVGGFNSFVHWESLRADAPDASFVQEEAQQAGFRAVTGRGFLCGEYILSSAAMSMRLRIHFGQEDRAANYTKPSGQETRGRRSAAAEQVPDSPPENPGTRRRDC